LYELNNALEPSGPYDINSYWSGSAIILPGEKPAILYTGIDHNKNQVQNLAIPKNVTLLEKKIAGFSSTKRKSKT